MAKSKGVRIIVTLECTECRTATAAENAALEFLAIQQIKPKKQSWKARTDEILPTTQQDNSSSRNKIEEKHNTCKLQTPNNLVSKKLLLSFLSKHGRVHASSNSFWSKNQQPEPHISQCMKHITESSLINTNQSIQTLISRIWDTD